MLTSFDYYIIAKYKQHYFYFYRNVDVTNMTISYTPGWHQLLLPHHIICYTSTRKRTHAHHTASPGVTAPTAHCPRWRLPIWAWPWTIQVSRYTIQYVLLFCHHTAHAHAHVQHRTVYRELRTTYHSTVPCTMYRSTAPCTMYRSTAPCTVYRIPRTAAPYHVPYHSK